MQLDPEAVVEDCWFLGQTIDPAAPQCTGYLRGSGEDLPVILRSGGLPHVIMCYYILFYQGGVLTLI